VFINTCDVLAVVKALIATKKKSKNRRTFLRVNPLRSLKNAELPTYLALRRQKVKLGALKQSDEDLEMFMCLQPAVVLED
jgi:hypothetical protein